MGQLWSGKPVMGQSGKPDMGRSGKPVIGRLNQLWSGKPIIVGKTSYGRENQLFPD